MSLRQILVHEEGWRNDTYLDSRNNLTWGVGHLDPHSPLGARHTDAQIGAQLDADISTATGALERLIPWVVNLDQVRREAVIDMAFQMGAGKVMGFHNMLADLQVGNYAGASANALDSAWARETPNRARGVAKRLETGAET
jgi:lysozyme